MRLFGIILVLWACCAFAQTPDLDPKQIQTIFEQAKRHKHRLQLQKNQLLSNYDTFHNEKDALLQRLINVKLQDLEAFESLIFGMMKIYETTVDKSNRLAKYDFRTPALQLAYEFEHAIKESHLSLKGPADDLGHEQPSEHPKNAHKAYAPHHSHSPGDAEDSSDTMNQLLHGMLQEVRENADHLEQGMHQNSPALGSDQSGSIETVRKLRDNTQGKKDDDSVATLIDQDNNEYIMTRPFDTTVIYEDMQLLHDLILIIVISFAFGWLFSAIGLPAFFGYILAGIISGPSGYNLIKELIQTETLAQLGVVLILFVLGLEFSLDKIKAMWRLTLSGAVSILFVTVIFFVGLGVVLGTTLKEAVFMGACVSLSSTAVVVRCIRLDQLEHLYGLLVMQDVLLGFMLAILPALAKSGIQIVIAILKTFVSFGVFGLVCFAVMPESHELTMLGVITLCMLMLLISDHLGLGMEIGCFAAGVIIRTRKHLFEASIVLVEPIRDLFACLFFASIGLHIYPSFLASEAVLLLTLAAAVIGFKYIVTCVILLFNFDIHKSSTMALALAQISEFGFVLASRAKQLNIITREAYYLLLGVTALSLMATPILWKVTNKTPLNPSHGLHREQEEYAPVIVSFDETDKLA
ncbi:Sodium/hydrogen exchanger family-domain-containing protein [Phycomyces nitens]|nr:Sodium/hydrogen exchanger family-domain-containing protein [Phycomyces nitens]